MKNKYLITLLFILMIFALTGCNKKKAGSEPGATEQVSDTSKPSDTEEQVSDTSKPSDAKATQAVSDSSQPEKQADDLNAPALPDDTTVNNRYESGFYGVWISGVKDRDKAIEDAKALNNAAFDSYVCYTPEWEEMNQDEYYCVTSGRYTTKEEAEVELEAVKNAGYGDAYIKFTGGHKYTMVDYTNYGDLEMDVNDDRVILRDVRYVISRAWYEGMEDEEYVSDLVIDKQTVFDKKCEMEFFGNYNEGDDPLKWFVTNYDLMERNSDLYMSNGPALSGVFEVGLTGNHIDRYFGSYWWD